MGRQIVSLGDLCSIVAGGTPPRTKREYFGGKISWVKITDMLQGEITSTEEGLTEEGLRNSSAKILPSGTVLVSIFATIGRTAILGIDAATNQAIAGLTPRNPDKLLSEYLRFSLDSSVEHLKRSARGVAQPNINSTILKSLPVPFVPLDEQRRIVDILKRADGIRRLRKQAIQTARDLVSALFVEMFGDPAANPKGWEIVPVSSFVSRFEGGKNIKAAGENEIAGTYRVLKISAVTYGEFRPTENKPVAADYVPPREHLVKVGDLLFSRANTEELVGATAYVFGTPQNLLLPDKLWRFVWPNKRIVEPLFVWALFQNQAIRARMSRLATGTGGSMKNISQKKLLAMSVPLPPIDLQKSFVERFMSLRSITQQQYSGELHSTQLFRSLLHRAFHGEL